MRLYVVVAAMLIACGGGSRSTPTTTTAPAKNAYVEGGVPHYDDVLGKALDALPPIPSETSWLGLRDTVLSDALPGMWNAALEWRAGKAEISHVNEIAQQINAKLRHLGLGYFVHVHFEDAQRGRVATLRTYTVRSVAIAQIDKQRIAVLQLEPMGENTTPSAAGQTFQDLPLVHMRAITFDAVNLIAALSTKRVIEVGRKSLETVLDRLVVDEVREMFGTNVARAEEVGHLLVRWARARGAMYLDVERERQLPPTTNRDLAGIEDALTEKRARDLIADVERRMLRRVQLHEVQHALDYKTARSFNLSEPLMAVMGPTLDLRGRVLASMELSAWSATFAREFAWWDVVQGIHGADTAGVPTGYAFAFLIDTLARRFDASAKPSLENGAIDQSRLADNIIVLAKHDRAALSAAARALWESWYGTKLEDIQVSP